MFSIHINKRFLITALSISCAVFFTQCKDNVPADETTVSNEETTVVHLSDAQLSNMDLELGAFSERPVSNTLKLNGKIDVPPQNLISITNPLGGFLKSTKLLPGMAVQKGDLIATMEDPQYIQLQQDYLIAKDKFMFAKLDYERQKELNASQASSDKVMQNAQAEMNSQRIAMNALAQQLSLLNINTAALNYNTISKSINIYSPITGSVSSVFVNVGRYITPSDVMFELINPSDIHLKLKVYEKDLDKLEKGQKVISYTNNSPSKKYEGTIILISSDVDADGVSEVHCHFDSFDKNLLPGMYMNADVEVHSILAQSLPEESIVYFDKKNYIFIEKAKQTYEMVAVSLGAKENGFVQIENIQDVNSDKVVVKGAYTLLMKLKNTEEEE